MNKAKNPPKPKHQRFSSALATRPSALATSLTRRFAPCQRLMIIISIGSNNGRIITNCTTSVRAARMPKAMLA